MKESSRPGEDGGAPHEAQAPPAERPAPEPVAQDPPSAATTQIAMAMLPDALEPLPALDDVTRETDYKLPLRTWSVPVLAISGLASLTFVIAFWLNIVTGFTGPDGVDDTSFGGLVYAILHQTESQARGTLSGLGEVMAAVLGLALTVSSIIVQLAATRFTPHITSLFFRARTNLLVLGFFVTATVFVVWVNFSIAETYVPRWGVLLSMVLMTASLLLLFPYFAYVFDFLDPKKIVGRITSDGLDAAKGRRGRAAQRIDKRQQQATEAVEHLTNIGLNALQQKDKNIASSAVEALCTFGIEYYRDKASLKLDWFNPQASRHSPDFVSLSNEAIDDLRRNQTWLEWKILRQYQMLFAEGLTQIKDICYLVAIDTRRLGGAAAVRNDLNALDLAIKFFNTYLRFALNVNDVRTAYNILHQYRQLGEMVLGQAMKISREARGRDGLEREKAASQAADLESRALKLARHMRYYSSVAFQKGGGMVFIAGVIAHDIGTLCAFAFYARSKCHDQLLEIFLGVDDATESPDKQRTLRDVRLAQVKLATVYLVRGANELARRVADDMRGEDAKRLRGMWHFLVTTVDREFFEVSDRGYDFNYLPPNQKSKLPQFFKFFDGLRLEDHAEDDTVSIALRP